MFEWLANRLRAIIFPISSGDTGRGSASIHVIDESKEHSTGIPHTPLRNSKAIASLKSWLEDDDTYDEEPSFEQIMTSLDEHRLSARKLFP